MGCSEDVQETNLVQDLARLALEVDNNQPTNMPEVRLADFSVSTDRQRALGHTVLFPLNMEEWTKPAELIVQNGASEGTIPAWQMEAVVVPPNAAWRVVLTSPGGRSKRKSHFILVATF